MPASAPSRPVPGHPVDYEGWRVEETLRSVALPLLRFSAFAGAALVFGLIPIARLVLRPIFATLDEDWTGARRRVAIRLESLALAGLVVVGTATAVLLVMQATLFAELRTGRLSAAEFQSVFDTTFGQWYAFRFPLIAALAVLLAGRVSVWSLTPGGEDSGPGLIWWGTWTILSVALLATSSFSGHAAVAVPVQLSIGNDVVHLAAGATWFTGIVTLAIALPDAWRSRAEANLIVLAPVVVRFARVALISVSIVALTGLFNSFLHLDSPRDLIASSYGRTLALKLIAFAVILVLGALNHWGNARRLDRALRQGSSAPISMFRRAIAAELVVGLLILTLTGVLVGLPRTREAAMEFRNQVAIARDL